MALLEAVGAVVFATAVVWLRNRRLRKKEERRPGYVTIRLVQSQNGHKPDHALHDRSSG